MSKHFIHKKIIELEIQLIDGDRSSRYPKDADFRTSGIPFLSTKNIVEGRVRFEEANFVGLEKYNEITKGRLQKNDIVITTRGSIGKLGYFYGDDYPTALINAQMLLVRADPNSILPRYLFYILQSEPFQALLTSYASGSAQPQIPKSHLEQLRIPVFPLVEQQRISEILGALDDKIELNRRMNLTLEAMARALFQSWFVDFDPVHAKARGEMPYGMDEATAALFPDSFEETAVGRVPRGWEVSTIGEEFNLLMGQSPPGETYNEIGDGLPFYQGRRDFGVRFPSIRVFCNAPSRVAQRGDSLVSVRAPVGDVNMALEDCCIGRGVAAIRHKSMAKSFTYYSMLAIEAIFKNFEGEGTVFGSISGKDFRNIPLIKPCNMVVAAFEKFASPLDEQIRVNEMESRTLATLRETLLPKLVSGEMRLLESIFVSQITNT